MKFLHNKGRLIFAICLTMKPYREHGTIPGLISLSPGPGVWLTVFMEFRLTQNSWMNPMNQLLVYGGDHFAVARSWLQCRNSSACRDGARPTPCLAPGQNWFHINIRGESATFLSAELHPAPFPPTNHFYITEQPMCPPPCSLVLVRLSHTGNNNAPLFHCLQCTHEKHYFFL